MGMTVANVTPMKAMWMMMVWSILNGWFFLVWLVWDSLNERGFLCVLFGIGYSNLIVMVEWCPNSAFSVFVLYSIKDC